MPNNARILTIDGGGIRGIIPATVLRHVEARLGRLDAAVLPGVERAIRVQLGLES